jgi:hypothetical protein
MKKHLNTTLYLIHITLFVSVCLWGDDLKNLFNKNENIALIVSDKSEELKLLELKKDIYAVKLGLIQYEGQGNICLDYSSSVFQQSFTINYP